MKKVEKKDVQVMSNPIVKIEEVSEKNLSMLNCSRPNFSKVKEDLKSMKVTLSKLSELEPIQVVEIGNKFQVVDGISSVNFLTEVITRSISSNSMLDIPIPQLKFLKINKSVYSK